MEKRQLVIEDINLIPESDREIIEGIMRDCGIEPKYYVKTDIDILIEAVQDVFRVTLDELKSNSRKGNLPYARRVVFYYATKIYPRRFPKRKIGDLLNKKQSSAHVAIGLFKIENNPLINHEFYRYILQVKERLQGYKFVEE